MYKKLIYLALPLCIMGLIYWSSSQPYEQQDIRPTMNVYLPLDMFRPIVEPISFTYDGHPVSVATHGVDGMVEFFIRKAAHVTVFFLLMITTYLAFSKTMNWKFPVNLLAAFTTTVLYAGLDEFHQSLTPNRTPYIGDVVLDSIGGLVGVLVIQFFYWRKSKRTSG